MQTRRMELMGLQEVDWKESEMINKSEIGEWFGAFTSTNMIETIGKITTMQAVLLSKLLAFTVFYMLITDSRQVCFSGPFMNDFLTNPKYDVRPQVHI